MPARGIKIRPGGAAKAVEKPAGSFADALKASFGGNEAKQKKRTNGNEAKKNAGEPRKRPEERDAANKNGKQRQQQAQGTGKLDAKNKNQQQPRAQTQPKGPAQTKSQAQAKAPPQSKSPTQTGGQTPPPPPPIVKNKKPAEVKEIEKQRPQVWLPRFVTVANLAHILRVSYADLQLRMAEQGFEETNHDFVLDEETAVLIAGELGFEAAVNEQQGLDLFAAGPVDPDTQASYPLRPPIVTIMGHVDHGKTTILDYLRKTSVAAKEHGGITQHIGAFLVQLKNSDRKICFLDTPGHAAFLNMRQRGANVTDIVILVVAGDDSVMPQTKEAIKHARNAGVPMIVAVNKMDKPDAKRDRVVADLAANDVDVEDYGGDTQVISVSGKTGLGIDALEEAIVALSELLDVRAPKTSVAAEGWIIESQVKRGMGPVATVLVKRGTLKAGSIVVAGEHYAKVRTMRDDAGRSVRQAGPGTPVEVLGWKSLPEAGDEVLEAESENQAKTVIENRQARAEQLRHAEDISAINERRRQWQLERARQEEREARLKAGLEVDDADNADASSASGPEPVNIIVKADVSGSAEAVAHSIAGLGNDRVQARVISSSVGEITESDVKLAQTANATIVTFNIKTGKDAYSLAGRLNVKIISHTVIYHLLEDITGMLTSRLAPVVKHRVVAEGEVREVFTFTLKNKSKLQIAGCRVTNGTLSTKDSVRVLRNKEIVFDGKIDSMKHHKDEIQEAKKGSECGITFDGWTGFQAGDAIQTYESIHVQQHL